MAEGVERGDNSAMSQNSSLMSEVDCLLTTWAPDQMSCIVHKPQSPTSSSSTLFWLSKPFLGGVNESRLTKRPALSCRRSKVSRSNCSLFCFVHLGDPEIWNTGLALRRRESALLVPQSGAEALLPLEGGGRHGEGGVVRRHLSQQG